MKLFPWLLLSLLFSMCKCLYIFTILKQLYIAPDEMLFFFCFVFFFIKKKKKEEERKNVIFFISRWEHVLWYSLEVLRQAVSYDYPQHIFSGRNKKNMWIPTYIWRYTAAGWFVSSLLEYKDPVSHGLTLAPDQTFFVFFFNQKVPIISYFTTKTYVVGTH